MPMQESEHPVSCWGLLLRIFQGRHHVSLIPDESNKGFSTIGELVNTEVEGEYPLSDHHGFILSHGGLSNDLGCGSWIFATTNSSDILSGSRRRGGKGLFLNRGCRHSR